MSEEVHEAKDIPLQNQCSLRLTIASIHSTAQKPSTILSVLNAESKLSSPHGSCCPWHDMRLSSKHVHVLFCLSGVGLSSVLLWSSDAILVTGLPCSSPSQAA